MSKISVDRFKPFMNEINCRADRLIERTLLGYYIFGIFLAFFYDTWLVGLGVGSLSLILYFGVKFLLRGKRAHQYIGSLVVGIFMAQFIYQMHGLFEMHFTAFVAIIVLMAYQDYRVFIPATLFIAIHHASFAYIQYLGFIEGNEAYQSIYFTQLDYMDLQTFVFHVGLVVVAVIIASIYSINSKERSFVLFEKLIESEDREKATKVNIEFAKEIANNNYDKEFDVDEDNPLSAALIDMRDSLKKSSLREEQERFTNKGLAELSNIIRDNGTNLKDLTYEVIEFLVKYMKLNQGGFFIVTEDEKGETVLELQGAYAYDRRKKIKKQLMPGEGLVGQSYQEKDSIYLTEVPDDYINIKSGLGDANPRSIIITPVKRDETIEGVIELASFRVLKEYEKDFLEKAGESIAVALNTAKVTQRTTELYEQSQQQTEEMRAQEEEMRQNMEELSATQEEMQRTQKDYEIKLAETQKENEELKKKLAEK
ncbi:GAF domain-containing protein [Marivirga arenosa]|uniref:GAF domain-containing protein n=1 Tax=Marivirga arenosa TaxID=3059076 RepID=A0AA51N4V8_9BACT|nr:GAF domain-containing protein [Marivirga sp. ABR2-2]WMN06073.1 GAF domain-containing protein [Marivirga sp. ABR2-2]